MDASPTHDESPSAEEFLEMLGRSSADGVYAVDDEQRIVYWSPAAEVLTGRAAADVCGKRCFDVMVGDDEEGNAFCRSNCPTIMAAKRGRPIPSYDISAQTGDGRRAWFNVSIIVLPGRRSRDLRAAHMFRDVTARRRAEAFAEAIIAPHRLLVGGPAQTRRIDASAATALKAKLTTRELEVLRLLGQGLSTTAIAGRLNLSKATVRNHFDRLRSKLGAHSRIEALVRAGQLGIA